MYEWEAGYRVIVNVFVLTRASSAVLVTTAGFQSSQDANRGLSYLMLRFPTSERSKKNTSEFF